MTRSPEPTSPAYYLAAVALLAALGIGAALLYVLTVGSPDGGLEVSVGPPEAEDCPVGSGTPVCYRFDVTNVGDAQGTARCIATAPSGTLATFPNGTSTADVLLAQGETKQVYVRVQADGTVTVRPPALSCDTR